MIPGIDGLRAIAVLALLAFHVNGYDFGFGWQGVQFFFVLSGFLITGILLRMKETLPVKQYFFNFYGRRFLRIFPLYYFYLFILTIAFMAKQSASFETFKGRVANHRSTAVALCLPLCL
jgi:peptidoglycan/LPS O-acetylase OafA/YrhL